MTKNSNYPLPQSRALDVEREGSRIPTVYWEPSGIPRGVVLACHGGSGHKESNAIILIAQACLPLGLTVLAIDGPVHGERRADGNFDPAAARLSFREAWRGGVGHITMAEDMRMALNELQKQSGYGDLPVGYVGVSMGTAYGLPLLAHESRIQAAAIGLWGTTYPASEHLAGYASQVRCSVWFTQQWNDEFFDREGTFSLFDALGTEDKRLVAYPGPHKELEGSRLTDAVDFLAKRLIKT